MSNSLPGPGPSVVAPSGMLPFFEGPIPLISSPRGAETTFHFSINISDLERSVEFYRVFFGREPAKHHRDYAKFELNQPPLVFSLAPGGVVAGGTLNHLGLKFQSIAEIESVRQRLRSAGLASADQSAAVQGDASQSRMWVRDPDMTHWELYVSQDGNDLSEVHLGFTGSQPLPAAATETRNAPVVWEHRVMEPVPVQIPHADGTVDEVRLEGLFNGDFSAATRAGLLTEVRRVLKGGGQVHAHGLVSNRQLAGGFPSLPGIAALVKQVPVETEPLDELAAAGFSGLHFTKFAEAPAFQFQGVEMREVKLQGFKPDDHPREGTHSQVLYRGPFAEATDEEGNVYPRGRRVTVSRQTRDELARSAAADGFEFCDD